jgi:predicted enzyme related to lactoylglutathione lyase
MRVQDDVAMNGENPVVHFEMPYEDEAQLTGFYQQAFGWGMHSTGLQMGDYVTAQTAPTDENRMVTSPGTINSGFYPRSPDGPQHPSVVIAVEDIGVAMRRVTDASGTVVGEPVAIPGIGHYASFTDTEGNRVSLLQPSNR